VDWRLREMEIASPSTECGRMDSHISKGNKKRMKEVTEKSFIFSKSTYNLVFSPLGFENNIT